MSLPYCLHLDYDFCCSYNKNGLGIAAANWLQYDLNLLKCLLLLWLFRGNVRGPRLWYEVSPKSVIVEMGARMVVVEGRTAVLDAECLSS